jgi:hypothetical protein
MPHLALNAKQKEQQDDLAARPLKTSQEFLLWQNKLPIARRETIKKGQSYDA